MKQLDLSDHARTIVYEHIVLALKNDPTLKVTISPDGWRTYTDEDNNDAPPGEDTLPSIEVLPFGAGASPVTPVSQASPMGISINVGTDGLDVRDLLNLWGAVENALFPGDGSRVLNNAIRDALTKAGTGAQLETINLGSPAITPPQAGIDNQQMLASGTLFVSMRVRK